MTTSQPLLAQFESLSTPDLIERFAQGSSRFERRVLDLTDTQLDTFFRREADVGQWSCRTLIGHVADADLAQVHRMRRTIAEERPVLALWDENAFIDAGLYGDEKTGPRLPVAGHIALIHTVRLWAADWLRTLDDKAFDSKALHPERGEQTVRRMLTLITWHLEHHAWYLSRKLEKLLGPASE